MGQSPVAGTHESPLLILDLDETLILGTRNPLSRPPDLVVGVYAVYHRPHVAEFLSRVRTRYATAVWTSATESYAAPIVRSLFPRDLPPAFLWHREHCTLRRDPETMEEFYLKKLQKVERLGFALERVLMVDDEPRKLGRNYGNHIRITPYEGSADDAELPLLCGYLLGIADCPDFRRLEKRRWRANFEPC